MRTSLQRTLLVPTHAGQSHSEKSPHHCPSDAIDGVNADQQTSRGDNNQRPIFLKLCRNQFQCCLARPDPIRDATIPRASGHYKGGILNHVGATGQQGRVGDLGGGTLERGGGGFLAMGIYMTKDSTSTVVTSHRGGARPLLCRLLDCHTRGVQIYSSGPNVCDIFFPSRAVITHPRPRSSWSKKEEPPPPPSPQSVLKQGRPAWATIHFNHRSEFWEEGLFRCHPSFWKDGQASLAGF